MPWNTGSILKSKGSHAISQEKGKKCFKKLKKDKIYENLGDF